MTEQTGVVRCAWAGSDALMHAYHDTEWGVPVLDGQALYEKLVIDGFQAGLSWAIILRKRESTRQAFEGFDPARVAGYGDADVARLLADPGIVRNRAKVNAAIANARAFLAVESAVPGGFAGLIWDTTGGRTIQNAWSGKRPAETDESRALSKRLKGLGFKFCGPTIIYAFMQAVGLVNDHSVDCFRFGPVGELGLSGAHAPHESARSAQSR